MSAQPPIFTSSPPTAASEGVSYSYTITATDPAGGTVTFALSQAPVTASLSGDTLTWTPSSAQSRASNSFTVTATSSEGGHATQSWSVSPAGTIRGTWVDTRWTPDGSANSPLDWTKARFLPQALVPQPDGSFVTLSGTGNSDGTFTIPGVPAGFYWMQLGFTSFWSSSSTFDAGSDVIGRPIGTIANTETTSFAFNVSGLEPVEAGDQFAFLTDWASISSILNVGFAIPSPPGSTTMQTTYHGFNSNIDYSSADVGYMLQYEPVSAGSITGIALVSELTLPDLSLTSGITNNVDGTLNSAPPASFDLNVKGSQWAPMFQNAGPGPVTPIDAYISLSARPFAPANVFAPPLNLPLFLPPLHSNGFGFIVGWPTAGICNDAVLINPQDIVTSYPPILSDQDFGALTYGDPFDAAWARVFSLCQTGSVEVPVPGGGTPATFLFADGVNTAIPSSPVVPLALPVQNPMINGSTLFDASTVNPNGVTLSWTAPPGAPPFAYKLALLVWSTLPDGSQGYVGAGSFYTAKTSMTLPPVQAGRTYVFVLTTEVDGRANVETSPRRSGLPTSVASIISAPITTSSAQPGGRAFRRRRAR